MHTINSENEVAAIFTFDFGNYNLPAECFTQSDAFEASKIMMSSDFATIGRFLKNDNTNIV